MEYFLFILVDWFPLCIWVILCIYGIIFGFKEMIECREDIEIVEHNKESLKYIVAFDNRKNSRNNIIVQALFLFVAALTTYFKLQEENQVSSESLLRAIVVPTMFIYAEFLLISNLRRQSSTRHKIKERIRLEKEGN